MGQWGAREVALCSFSLASDESKDPLFKEDNTHCAMVRINVCVLSLRSRLRCKGFQNVEKEPEQKDWETHWRFWLLFSLTQQSTQQNQLKRGGRVYLGLQFKGTACHVGNRVAAGVWGCRSDGVGPGSAGSRRRPGARVRPRPFQTLEISSWSVLRAAGVGLLPHSLSLHHLQAPAPGQHILMLTALCLLPLPHQRRSHITFSCRWLMGEQVIRFRRDGSGES